MVLLGNFFIAFLCLIPISVSLPTVPRHQIQNTAHPLSSQADRNTQVRQYQQNGSNPDSTSKKNNATNSVEITHEVNALLMQNKQTEERIKISSDGSPEKPFAKNKITKTDKRIIQVHSGKGPIKKTTNPQLISKHKIRAASQSTTHKNISASHRSNLTQRSSKPLATQKSKMQTEVDTNLAALPAEVVNNENVETGMESFDPAVEQETSASTLLTQTDVPSSDQGPDFTLPSFDPIESQSVDIIEPSAEDQSTSMTVDQAGSAPVDNTITPPPEQPVVEPVEPTDSQTTTQLDLPSNDDTLTNPPPDQSEDLPTDQTAPPSIDYDITVPPPDQAADSPIDQTNPPEVVQPTIPPIDYTVTTLSPDQGLLPPVDQTTLPPIDDIVTSLPEQLPVQSVDQTESPPLVETTTPLPAEVTEPVIKPTDSQGLDQASPLPVYETTTLPPDQEVTSPPEENASQLPVQPIQPSVAFTSTTPQPEEVVVPPVNQPQPLPSDQTPVQSINYPAQPPQHPIVVPPQSHPGGSQIQQPATHPVNYPQAPAVVQNPSQIINQQENLPPQQVSAETVNYQGAPPVDQVQTVTQTNAALPPGSAPPTLPVNQIMPGGVVPPQQPNLPQLPVESQPAVISVGSSGPGQSASQYCPEEIESLGCYASPSNQPKLFPILIATKNPSDTLEDFLCSCANKVQSKGWYTFTLQNGKCYSGENESAYASYGESEQCINDSNQPCTENDVYCQGTRDSMNVYSIITPDHPAVARHKSH